MPQNASNLPCKGLSPKNGSYTPLFNLKLLNQTREAQG